MTVCVAAALNTIVVWLLRAFNWVQVCLNFLTVGTSADRRCEAKVRDCITQQLC
jgi:hypothetical protein